MKTSNAWLFAAVFMIFGALPGCAEPQTVRDTEMRDIDDRTMSVRLDRNDVWRLFEENIEKLVASPTFGAWQRQADTGALAAVAIYPIRNETEQDVDAALNALLSKFEDDLVGRSVVDVISYENQPMLIAEAQLQQTADYDAQRAAAAGKQVGAQFFITGKFFGVYEQLEDTQRVQYFVNFQVIDIETGQAVFQNTSSVEPTKGEF